ncbi:MAG: TIGR04282 family arsenosugar biosynthesis glycosyltransferase [Thermodesulfobacteriota bacterium]
MENEAALAVMVKAPVPGHVKTRLTPPLTADEAAGLYRAFLIDLFVNLKGCELAADIFSAITPPGNKEDFSGLIPDDVGCFLQRGEGLGDRIENVFKSLFEKGYTKAVITGSDSPDMPLCFIEEALAALDEPGVDIVFGPAHDGGYYLVAASCPVEAPFRDIEWSGPDVLEETLARVTEAELGYRLLEPWHDVDRPADLKFLLDCDSTPCSRAFIETLTPEIKAAIL